MQVHTKKHPTEIVELRFMGPIANIARAIESLKPLGFVDTSDSVPWREAYPELKDEDLPGVCLRGSRYREGISQRKLSEMTGIPQRHISEMENGKRGIGKAMAKRLGKALNIGYKVFL